MKSENTSEIRELSGSRSRTRLRSERAVRLRRVRMALPWLVACVHASSWADPMRPLTPPAGAAAAPQVAAGARSGQPREGEGLREPDRLIAIRQDSTARWHALFGERWVGAGDKLERYTIAAIDANSVQLAEGRAKKTLYLLPPLLRPEPARGPPGTSERSQTSDPAQAHAAALSSQRASGLPTP